MATGQNVNMRFPDELLERVDHNATAAGLSRTQYVLSWLPETYEQPGSNGETQAEQQSKPSR